jgi:hypothetical protein
VKMMRQVLVLHARCACRTSTFIIKYALPVISLSLLALAAIH